MYIGRLRGAATGPEYYIFDKGLKRSDMKLGQGKELERRQLGTIIYPQDKLGDKGPRKMNVYVPHITGEKLEN